MVVGLLNVELHLSGARSDESHADRELAAAAEEIDRVEPGLVTRRAIEFLT